jgi:hypothetical protein
MSRDDSPVTHRSALYVPPDTGRRERRAAHRAARDAHKTDAKARRAASRAAHAEQRRALYLPKAGEPGPAALRCWLPFRVKPHRATTAVLAHAYPFLAEAGLGSAGVLIGRDTYSGGSFVYDPWVLYGDGVLTNPNVLLAGVIGTGKSVLGKSLTTRSIAFGRRVYVPGDPKGEWTSVAQAVGGHAIQLGPGLSARLNPLDPGSRPAGLEDSAWTRLVWQRRRDLLGSLSETVLVRALHPVEHTALDGALAAASTSIGVPTLPHVVDALLDPPVDAAASTRDELREDGRPVGHALRRLVHGDLAGLFDGPSTIRFDSALPMLSLDLSAVTGSDALLSLVMTCASAWMEAALLDPNAGQRWIVYDEAWRIMRQPALVRRMQAQWKLSRAYGIANLMIIHRLSDLDAVGEHGSESRALAAGLLADCSTRIIYRQEPDQLGSTATQLGLTDTEKAILPDLSVGEGLWRVRDRAFRIQHQLTPAEAELFDTTSRMCGTTPDDRDGANSAGESERAGQP